MQTLDWTQRDNNAIVFCDLDGEYDMAEFRQHVTVVQNYLLANNINSCVLYQDNTALFLVQLMACVISAVDVILPANLTQDLSEERRQAMQADCDLINCSLTELSMGTEIKSLKILADDNKLTIFTSGSTGKPQAISRRFSQLMAEVNELDSLWGELAESSIFIASVSHQHIYGLLFKLLWPFYARVRLWSRDITYEESLGSFNDISSPLIFISSPAFLKRIQGEYKDSLSIYRTYSSGGKLSNHFHQQAEQHLNTTIIQVYGSSETGGIAYRQLNPHWHFFPSVEHRIDEGLLWVKSPFCCHQNWHNTQDRVSFDSHGNNQIDTPSMQLLGRADRIAKIEDKRVSLNQIEKCIKSHPWITDCKVIVIAGHKQMLAAVISLIESDKIKHLEIAGDEKMIKQNIRHYLKDRVEPLAIPRLIRIVDTLPSDQQGKTTLAMLRQLFN